MTPNNLSRLCRYRHRLAANGLETGHPRRACRLRSAIAIHPTHNREPRGSPGPYAKPIESGRLTDGPLTRELEERSADTFQVDHCVAVSSCTIGLMLLIQALEPNGPVLVPSFTFAATAHAAAWNSLPLLFADCSPATWCLRPEDIDGDPAVVLAVHVSGVPCDVAGLRQTADELGADLIYDAAHGAGSAVEVAGVRRPLGGFGRAEVFSLTPTKVLSGAEGGLITTNDEALAERLRVARNYGNAGRLRHQVLGAQRPSFRVSCRNRPFLVGASRRAGSRAQRTRAAVSGKAEWATWSRVSENTDRARSSYKDFTLLVDSGDFGCSRDALATALAAEGVETRKYYSPPVHRQTAYRSLVTPELPTTDRLAQQVISLPMWSHLNPETVDRICEAVADVHNHAPAIAAQLGS